MKRMATGNPYREVMPRVRAARRRRALHRSSLAPQNRMDDGSNMSDLGSVAGRKRPVFGAYKGRFSVGPEFFEPLSEEDVVAWGR